MKGTLYVLPALLAPENLETLSLEALEILENLTHFAVENVKTTRRMLRSLGIETDFNQCNFYPIHHKTNTIELNQTFNEAISALENGADIGILSEAGMAGIADPGSRLIALAHQANIKVKPIVGPSSILLALCASGFNGQKFTFHGYLPIEERHRKDEIKKLEAEVNRSNATQIFIETPYRNVQLLKSLQEVLQPTTMLSIACNLTSSKEMIQTKAIQQWKTNKTNEVINKQPAVFLIGKT